MAHGYKLTLDISYYQQAMDWVYLKQYVDGFVFRVTYGVHKDTKFKEHVKNALDAGYTHLACYAWLRPDQNIKSQLDAIRDHLYGTPIKFVFVDLEQHGQGYLNLPPTYSGEVMSDKAWQMLSGLTTMGLTPAIYTRSTWIEAHARPMKTWMYRFPTWLASYPFASGRISLSWEELFERYAPKAFSPYYHSSWGSHLRKAQMWQWSGDKFVLPGVYADIMKSRNMPVDLNYTSNELFELFRVANDSNPLPEPPVQQYETWKNFSLLSMVVRNAPSKTATDTGARIRFNELFKVFEKVNADNLQWGKVAANAWVALNWSRKQSGDIEEPSQPLYEVWQCKASDGMRIRETPNGKDTGLRVSFNTTFKVYDKVVTGGYNWGRIGTSQWIALDWSIKL